MRARPALIYAALISVLVAAAARADSMVDDIWRLPWREAGGSLSGLVVSADGSEFVAVSDKGRIVEGRLQRDRDGTGQITTIEITHQGPLRDGNGVPVSGRAIDAEGLTRLPDGSLLVSFEAEHRIDRYETADAAATQIENPRDFRGLQNNSGLEALFSDPDGTVYAIPERSGRLDRPFPVYRYRTGRWSIPFTIPRRPPFLPVGADIGPDGRLYLLERHFHGFPGFSTRIRRFTIQGDTIVEDGTLFESSAGEFDNLEGLSAWRAPDGTLVLTTISDDNNSIFQRTEFVEFRLTSNTRLRQKRPNVRVSR